MWRQSSWRIFCDHRNKNTMVSDRDEARLHSHDAPGIECTNIRSCSRPRRVVLSTDYDRATTRGGQSNSITAMDTCPSPTPPPYIHCSCQVSDVAIGSLAVRQPSIMSMITRLLARSVSLLLHSLTRQFLSLCSDTPSESMHGYTHLQSQAEPRHHTLFTRLRLQANSLTAPE